MRSLATITSVFLLVLFVVGCPSTKQPTADFSASPQAGGIPLTIKFTYTGNVDLEGGTFLWDFGDDKGSSDPNPEHVYTEAGVYSVSLTVGNGPLIASKEKPDYINAFVPPIADAGPDRRSVEVNDLIILDGSGSTAPEGETLEYKWTFVVKPVGSAVEFDDNSTTMMPSFTIDLEGTYIISLQVNYGSAFSAEDRVTISTGNNVPVANAGDDQTSGVGETIILDGSGSTDKDSDPISYEWTFLSRPNPSTATFDDETSVSPSFDIDFFGEYEVQLKVSDGFDDSFDTVTISMSNSRPVAEAGDPQTVGVGGTAHLDGVDSTDVDAGDLLSYRWRFASKPEFSNAVLAGETTRTPTFLIDDPGEYVVELIVNDGTVDSKPDTVTISTTNSRPVAVAGANQVRAVGEITILEGSRSRDADGDRLTFSWSILSRPENSEATLMDATSVEPSFVIDIKGDYVIQLIVNDGALDSDPDTILIGSNTFPVAVADFSGNADVGETVTLIGTNSFDLDGDELSYSWSLISLPTNIEGIVTSGAVITNSNSENAMLTIDERGDYIAQLIVNDGKRDSRPDTVLVSVDNTQPVAVATQTGASIEDPTILLLDGTGSSDADGDALEYFWSIVYAPNGSEPSLTTPNEETTDLATDGKGIYLVQLTVNDDRLFSDPSDVDILVPNSPPIITALAASTAGAQLSESRPNRFKYTAKPSETVELEAFTNNQGDPIRDYPDRDSLTFYWDFSTPGGSDAELAFKNTRLTSFVMDGDKAYDFRFTLTANDGEADSEPFLVQVLTHSTASLLVNDATSPSPFTTVVVKEVVNVDAGNSLTTGTLFYTWSAIHEAAEVYLYDTSDIFVEHDVITNVGQVHFTPEDYGIYSVNVTVEDETGEDIAVTAINSLPKADASGTSIRTTTVVDFFAEIILDGSRSIFRDGGAPEYLWTIIADSAGAINELYAARLYANETDFLEPGYTNVVEPIFRAPFPGIYTVQLDVRDDNIYVSPEPSTVDLIVTAR